MIRQLTVEEIRQLVAEGKVAIPANKHHECLNPEGIGLSLIHISVPWRLEERPETFFCPLTASTSAGRALQ